MESRGTSPAGAVGPEEAPDLAAVFTRPGPFASVYLSTPPEIENAAQRSEQHWRNLRRQLESEGAPADVADAVEALVPRAHLDGQTLAVVADSSGVLVRAQEVEPPDRDLARWAPLPAVGPIIEWEQRAIPHLVVLADRVGADIAVFASHGRRGLSSVGAKAASEEVLRKVKPGGWSQRRFQERAENTWEANAKAVADRVATLAELVAARLIIVAGDVRAAAFLRDDLPERLAPLVVEIEGQRAVGVDFDSIADDVVRQVATLAAEDTVAFLAKLREERGQQDRAAVGVEETVAALTAAQVDTLLVHDDPGDDREVWFASDGPMVALDAETLKGYGVDSPARGRLVDALIRSAFLTGARVRIVPSSVAPDGVAALLRFTTTA